MRVVKLAWVGSRTDQAVETAEFFERVIGLSLAERDHDFWMLRLPDGSRVEVFGPGQPDNAHFTTGPVVGFLVENFDEAVEELLAGDVEIVFGPERRDDGLAWVHFRGPDGNVYELTNDPGVSRPA